MTYLLISSSWNCFQGFSDGWISLKWQGKYYLVLMHFLVNYLNPCGNIMFRIYAVIYAGEYADKILSHTTRELCSFRQFTSWNSLLSLFSFSFVCLLRFVKLSMSSGFAFNSASICCVVPGNHYYTENYTFYLYPSHCKIQLIISFYV